MPERSVFRSVPDMFRFLPGCFEGMPIGAKVTLRGNKMWEFLDRLFNVALPRVRESAWWTYSRTSASEQERPRPDTAFSGWVC